MKVRDPPPSSSVIFSSKKMAWHRRTLYGALQAKDRSSQILRR